MIKFNGPATYKIKVQGILSETFLSSFNGIKSSTEKDLENKYVTTIEIIIKDQAELSGIINSLYEWRYPILLVECGGEILDDL